MGEERRNQEEHHMALRETQFRRNLLNAGTDIKTVSSLLGHASIKMTEKYLHVIDQRKQKAINKLGKVAFDTETA